MAKIFKIFDGDVITPEHIFTSNSSNISTQQDASLAHINKKQSLEMVSAQVQFDTLPIFK